MIIYKKNGIKKIINKKHYIYFGLTQKEIDSMLIKYDSNEYLYKGINLSLSGLKSLINDNDLKEVEYYSKIKLEKFNICKNIYYDEKYDMIAASIPILLKIDNVHKI